MLALLAAHLPLPGLDLAHVAMPTDIVIDFALLDRQVNTTASLASVGLSPVLLAVGMKEAFRLVRPRALLDRRDGPGISPDWFRTLVLVLALLSALTTAIALERSDRLVLQPGCAFRVIAVASMLATTMLLWWLVKMVTEYGLGSGFWIMLIAPYLASVAAWLPLAAVYDPSRLTIEIACFAVLTAAVVTVQRAAPDRRGGLSLIWSPFLALFPVSLLQSLFVVVSDSPGDWISAQDAVWRMADQPYWWVIHVAFIAQFLWLDARFGPVDRHKWLIRFALLGTLGAGSSLLMFKQIPTSGNLSSSSLSRKTSCSRGHLSVEAAANALPRLTSSSPRPLCS